MKEKAGSLKNASDSVETIAGLSIALARLHVFAGSVSTVCFVGTSCLPVALGHVRIFVVAASTEGVETMRGIPTALAGLRGCADAVSTTIGSPLLKPPHDAFVDTVY
ncbi:MAG: hypothetical protein RSE16_09955 [Sphingobium sp.]|nr:MAG: hypothetical protein RSE16_09955 [Sphingobium sp.]